MVLSPNICYVCGGGGGVQSIFIRPIEKLPYFPFLESHEPPKGSHPPTKDGTVDCCNICYMFLQQQWDSYEKSRTPIVKRLYWLKRVDNRPFTGAEMRMQGEYAAQMMGLQYYPSNTGTMSPYDYSPGDGPTAPKQSSTKKGSASKPVSANSSQNTNESLSERANETTISSAALDLSTSRDESDIRDTSADIRDRSIEYRERPSNSDTFHCFTCDAEHSVNTSRLIHDQYTREGEPFFPFLATLKKTNNAKDESNKSYRVCRSCHSVLYEQWKYYTVKQVPLQQRIYKFGREPWVARSIPQGTGSSSPRSEVNSPVQHSVCYLCGQSYARTAMKMLHTRPPPVKNSKHSIYFPFVCELRRPETAHPIDQYGRVVSCRACYSYLQRQWQSYQQDNIAVEDRKFVLRPLTDPDSSHASYASSPSPGKSQTSSYLDDSTRSEIDTSKDMNPLNIQITDPSKSLKNPVQGLLAIAPHVATTSAPPVLPSSYPGFMYGAYPGSTLPLEQRPGYPGTENLQVIKQEVMGNVDIDRPLSMHEGSPARRPYPDIKREEDCASGPFIKEEKEADVIPNLDQSTDREEEIDVVEHHGSKDQYFHERSHSRQRNSESEQRRNEKSDYDVIGDTEREHDGGSVSSVSDDLRDATQGLAQGSKPTAPGLNGLSSLSRNTATVPPMTAPSPVSPATAGQQSGFAAALRKLAKQAEGPSDPQGMDPGLDSGRTIAENTNSPRAELPKRQSGLPKPLGVVGAGIGSGSEPTTAPPVVTIAPTSVTKPAYLTAERNGADRANSLMLDPLGIKPERDKMITPSSHDRGRDEERPRSKDSGSMAARLTPHSSFPTVSSTNSGRVENDTISTNSSATRGFQPYRPGDAATDAALRHAAAASLPGLSSLDAYTAYLAQAQAAQAAAYPGAYSAAHPSIRMDDPLLLERYRLMQSSLGYPYSHPGLMGHPALSPYLDPRSPYPPEMLAQLRYAAYLGHPGAKLPELSPTSAERLKSEEEQRRIEREREAAEREQREKERERREKEEKERAERERLEKERERKERERRLSGSSGNAGTNSIFSAERLLGVHTTTSASGSNSSLYPASLHEPLNLKRYEEAAPSGRHLHLNGEARSVAEESRAALAQAALVHSYRQALEATSSAAAQNYPPAQHSLSVPKLSTSGLSSSSNPLEPSSGPSFHRPFEAGAVTNGYEHRALSEHERLLKEREKMITEHRLSQEKAQEARKLAEVNKRLDFTGASRTAERLPSSEQSARPDLVIPKAHSGHSELYSSQTRPDPKEVHYNSSLASTTTQSSDPRRTMLSSSNISGKQSHSGYAQTDRQTPVKSNPSTQDKPLPPHHILSHPNSSIASQSALSSLQSFSQSSPAITSLSNMINSDNLLAGFGLETKVNPVNKDNGLTGSMRLNGAHAQHSSQRMRLQPEVTDAKKRQRLNSGDSSAVGSLSHRSKASPKRPSLYTNRHTKNRDSSYEPPAKRPHLVGEADRHVPRDPLRPPTADDLNQSRDYRQKAEFLFMLQLEAVPPERRRENEFIQKVCEWDKDRRTKARLFPPPPCSVDTIKLPYEYSTARISQFIAAYSSPLKRKHSPSSSISQQTTHQSTTSTSRSQDLTGNQSSSSVIATTNSGSGTGSSSTNQAHPPSVSAQFVQQFHESVLEQTRQQRMNKTNTTKSHQHQQHGAEVRYSLISELPGEQATSKSSSHTPSQSSDSSSNNLMPSSLQSMQQMTSQLVPGTIPGSKSAVASQAMPMQRDQSRQGSSGTSQPPSVTSESSDQSGECTTSGTYKWPGMEAVMMAYHKHLNECHTEKQILREQYNVLEQQHRTLSRQAEQLSKRMEEMLQNKHKNEEERAKRQKDVDVLRKCLSSLR